MTSASDFIFAEWSPPWLLTAAILALAVIYLRGFLAIRRTRPAFFPDWRLMAFVTGLFFLWTALASPLDGFADALLSAHMVQHLLLMSAVPPLLLLGLPVVPMLRGLPRGFVKNVLGPVLGAKTLIAAGRFLTRPVVAWLAMNLTFLLWHTPLAYDYALRHQPWHRLEHLCFLGTAMLFWWPVIQPWPAKRHTYGWAMLPYLLSADLVNTALSAFLAFCDRAVYSYYLGRNPFHVNPVTDQAAGGAIMWVIGSFAFLLPAVGITVRLVQQGSPAEGRAAESLTRVSGRG
jgi:cytochrome c oxidase assembly factor CtaG